MTVAELVETLKGRANLEVIIEVLEEDVSKFTGVDEVDVLQVAPDKAVVRLRTDDLLVSAPTT